MQTLTKLILQIQNARSVTLGFIIFVLLPAILIYGRIKLKALLKNVKNIQKRTYRKFLILLDAFHYPVYLILSGILVKHLILPESIEQILFKLMMHISFFVFLWLLNRQLFSRTALLVENFNMQINTAKVIYRTFKFLLISYVIVITPSMIFKNPPFTLETIPRIGCTIFGILALIKIFCLIRRSSPLIRDIQNKVRDCKIYKNWTIVSGFAMIVLMCTIVMDILGYRFGARWITIALLQSFFTVIILDFAYHLLIKLVKNALKKRKYNTETVAPGTQPQVPYQERVLQICGFIKTLFIVIGAFLFVIYWGMNQGVVNVLDKVKLYDLKTNPPEFITVAYIFKCAIILIITMWILRNLRGIYEITVFRKKIDAGVRYAI